jgi:adenylate cyclase
LIINFITRSLRSLGMIGFFLIAVLGVFSSHFVRDIDEGWFRDLVSFTSSFENRFFDSRLAASLRPDFKSKEIVFIKIDDETLSRLGTWPIRRTLYAQMVDKLGVFGAKTIGLDIMYPEESPSFEGENPDEIYAKAISRFGQRGGKLVIAYTLADDFAGADSRQESLHDVHYNDMVTAKQVGGANLNKSFVNRYTYPIERLLVEGAGLGYITSQEDFDGIFRQYKLLTNIEDFLFPSLAFSVYQHWKGKSPEVKIYQDNTAEVRIDDASLELDSDGYTKIRYLGNEQNFPTLALWELLEKKDDDQEMKNLFQGKMVIVGSTALGAHDLRASPIDAKMPGVLAHINFTQMLVNKHFFKSSNESLKYSLLLLCLGMIGFVLIQRLNNPFWDAGIIAFLVALSFYADKLYFLPAGYELKLFYCYFCFFTCYSWNTFLKFYEANKEKKQIRGTFARYVAPTIVDEMLKDPDKLHVGGTKMDITCLFSDVRDFTKISEGLSATELAHSLNLYMGAMTDIVFDYKGTLDKYIGDAIVAIWGAPLEIGNHAQFAVEGALKMMEILPGINEEFKKLGRPQFQIGIGLNSGECSVGNMGSDRIFSYTALGDNMNLGARLESLCKHYGTQILISDMTYERLDHTKIKTRPVDRVVVKGKTTAVGIHEVIHVHHWIHKDFEALDFYLTAYKLFTKKDFLAANEIFNQLLMSNPEDKPTKRLAELCQKYIQTPELVTQHFDVTAMTEK